MCCKRRKPTGIWQRIVRPLHGVDYLLLNRRGNGRAELAELSGKQAALQVSYTTCDRGSNGWRFQAERIDLDNEAGVGVARNARLHIGNVPVFYLPYVSFRPTTAVDPAFCIRSLALAAILDWISVSPTT